MPRQGGAERGVKSEGGRKKTGVGHQLWERRWKDSH